MKYLYKNNYWSINKNYNIDKLLYLMIDRPNKITKYNNFVWQNNKSYYHREYDLPSFVYQHEDKTHIILYWYKNSKQHREKSKPAYIDYNGYKQYYTNDKFIKGEWSKNEISIPK